MNAVHNQGFGKGPVDMPMHGLSPSTPLSAILTKSAAKGAALYVTLAFTPLSSMLFGFTASAPGVAALIFTAVDLFRKYVVNSYLPGDWKGWEHDPMGTGGDYTNVDNLWSNFKTVASCKACLVQSLIYFGFLTFSGMFSGQAAGLAATSFVSTVLFDYITSFYPMKY